MNSRTYMPVLGVLVLSLSACTETARLPLEAGVGPDPKLPPPAKTLIPTVHIPPATGWPEGARPVAAEGAAVNTFAAGLEHPRWLYVLPNGDVLVAETAAPPRPAEGKGIKSWFMQRALKDAGSAVPSANRITLLRDADGDGVARARLVELPAGPRNHHWTKNVVASPDGAHLYATVGSNSNVAEHGMQEEEGRAAVWEINRASASHRIYASGLRNPNGLAWEPRTGALWTAVSTAGLTAITVRTWTSA